MNNLNPKEEEIINRMIEDRPFRLAMVRKSHFWFFHYYFGRDYVRYQTADFQREIFQLTEDPNVQNLVITAFRGSAKSTIITLSYVIWSIVGEQQKKFPIILGHTQLKAQNHLLAIKKELEQNESLRSDLGPFRVENNQWGALSIILPQYGAKISIGSIEQSIRGLRHNQYRPDVFVCDDIEDSDSVKTLENRDKLFDWLTSDVLPAGDRGTRMIFIGTPLHEDSILMRLEKKFEPNDPKNVFRRYPILDDKGICVWPGKFPTPKDILDEKAKCLSEISWLREYMLKIVRDDYQVIPKEWIHYYDNQPDKSELLDVMIGVDLAISEKEKADKTAVITAFIYGTKDGVKICIMPHPINDRFSFSGTIKEIERLFDSHRDHAPTILIEDVGYQRSAAQQLVNDGYEAREVRITGDKRSRLVSISHLIQNGNIVFHRKFNTELIKQLTGFGVDRFDDLVDALTLIGNTVIQEDIGNSHDPIRFF